MRAWRSGEVPGIDGLALAEIAPPRPGPGELLVRMEAAAVNFSDLLMIAGRYQIRPDRPFTPGQEIAGIVEAAGPGAAFRPGERIAAKLLWGGFAERAVVRADMAMRLPDAIAPPVGAALPVVYTTAVIALTETVAIGAGDWILIFAATGGVGIAMTQVAKALGARVVVDTVGGEATGRGIECLAWRGEILIVGFLSGEVAKIPAHRLLLKGASARGIYWDHDRDRALVGRASARVLEMAGSGAIRPRVDARFRLADLPRALQALAQRNTVGKLVLAT